MNFGDFLVSNSRLLNMAAEQGDPETTQQLIERTANFLGTSQEDARELILHAIATKMEAIDRGLNISPQNNRS